MTFLCDTTVLFAASDRAHVHHARSLEVVVAAKPEQAFVSTHSLAELYATLSATPAPRMRQLPQVLEAVEHAAQVFTPVTATRDDYLWVLRHVSRTGGRSGQVFDALILKCAERARVDTVYTWNLAHFRRIAWPAMQARIAEPRA